MENLKKTIVIVGGGISGLALLHYLKKKFPSKEITIQLLEKAEVLGGTIQTQKHKDCFFETGPNGFINNREQTQKFIDELGIADALIEASDESKKRYICVSHQLQAFPKSIGQFLRFPLLSFVDKFRLLCEVFLSARDEPHESVYEFVNRRFGANVAHMLMDPMINGIFAGNIHSLNMKAAFPRIYEIEQESGSIISGYRQSIKSQGKPKLTSFVGGMGYLIAELEKRYHAQISTSTEVLKITQKKEGGRFTLQLQDKTLEADYLFMSTPAYVSGKLLDAVDTKCADLLKQINYAPILVYGLLTRKEDYSKLPEGFGYLIPSWDNKEILGVLFEDQIFENRCGKKDALLRVMLGGVHQTQVMDKSEEEILELIRSELFESLGFAGQFKEVFKRSLPQAIPQYDQDYVQVLRSLELNLTKYPNLYLAANYRGGISLNDCVQSAYQQVCEFKIN